MTDRILDIADQPARLRVRYEQLLIERDGFPSASMSLSEIAAIVEVAKCSDGIAAQGLPPSAP